MLSIENIIFSSSYHVSRLGAGTNRKFGCHTAEINPGRGRDTATVNRTDAQIWPEHP